MEVIDANDDDHNRSHTTSPSVVNVEDTIATTTSTIISESLIAFTKDIFYQNYCKELILKILISTSNLMKRRGGEANDVTTTTEPFESSTRTRRRTRYDNNINNDNDTTTNHHITNDDDDDIENDDDHHYHPMFEPISECISSMLYSILVLNRLQRTYGMEVCQLEYDNNNYGSPTSSVLGSNDIVTTKNNRQQRIRLVITSITSSLWILSIRYLSYLSIIKNDNYNHNNNEGSIVNTSSTITTTNNNQERLRGINRREYFERQRQEMLQRSTTMSSTTTNSSVENTNNNSIPNNKSSSSTKTFSSLRHKIQINIIYPFVQALSKALSYDILLLDGPHGLIEENGPVNPATTTTTTDNPNNNNNNNTNRDESNVEILYTIMLSLFKTHFAFYCINNNDNKSQYPINLIHRFMMMIYSQTKIIPEKNNKSQQKQKQQASIVIQSESFQTIQRMVGYMILVQASTSVIQCITRKIIHILIDRKRRRRNITISSSITTTNNAILVLEDETSHHNVHVPSFPIEGIVVSQQQRTRTTIHSTFSSYNSTTTNICVICRGQRQYSSCPTTCGHIFCWYCIHEWISKTPSCPVCRKYCTSKDIIILYQYD